MILEVNNLSFAYRHEPVLQDVSFRVKKNELLVLLGINGAGKSTLLKCLNRIHEPKQGSVLINGQDMKKFSAMDIARRVGYVPQYFEHGGVNVFEMVLLGRRPHIGVASTPADYEIVDEIMMLLEVDHLSERAMQELSGGEAQKVMIARALAQEPELLLLDEPTSNLDIRNQQELMRLVRHVVQGHGLSAVVTLHDLNHALRYGDRIVMLKDAGIAWCGRPDELTPELVRDVYGIEVFIEDIRGTRVVIVNDEQQGKGLGPQVR